MSWASVEMSLDKSSLIRFEAAFTQSTLSESLNKFSNDSTSVDVIWSSACEEGVDVRTDDAAEEGPDVC